MKLTSDVNIVLAHIYGSIL